MAESTAQPVARRGAPYRALAGVAVLVQIGLLCMIFALGIGQQDGQPTGDRSGWLYVTSLAQALVILVAAGVLLWKRPLVVLWLPVLSFFLMMGAEVVHAYRTTECTDAELSAVADLPPPAGTPPLEFQDEPGNGCIARFTSSLSGEQLFDHYRLTAASAGYEIEEPGEVVLEPGEEAPQSPGPLGLRKDPVTASVQYERAGDEGPAREQLWVVIEVHEGKR